MSKRTVLVTGCSTGIGLSTALLLVEEGFHVLAGVRKETDLKRMGELHRDITPLILDVTKESDLNEAVLLIEEHYSENFYGFVNNAGVMYPAPLELADLELMREEMNVNYFGAVSVTKKLLPFVKKCGGRVVNISSMNGRISMPAVGNYSATKFALEAFTDALRMEVAHMGVSVSLVEPGQIKTDIFDKALDLHNSIHETLDSEEQKSYGSLMKGIGAGLETGKNSPTDPVRVAEAVVAALCAEEPKLRYVVGDDAEAFVQMAKSFVGRDMDRQILLLFGM